MSRSESTQVRILAAEEYPLWDALVPTCASGTVYSLVAYLKILCAATAASFKIAGIFENGTLVGGVPLYEVSCGRIANRLLLYFNGYVLQAQGERHEKHLGLLAEFLNQQPYRNILLHCFSTRNDLREFQARGWRVAPTYTYIVPLQGEKPLWERLDKNIRRLVRKAEASGFLFREEVDPAEFFRLHLNIHKKKGAPLYLAKEQFERYLRDITQSKLGKVYGVYSSSGALAAAQVVLAGPCTLTHTICAVSCDEGKQEGATPLLRWKALERLSLQGFAANDLTDAALNAVTKFKSQLGGELKLNFVVQSPISAGERLVEAARESAIALLRPLKQILCSGGRQ